MKKIIGVIPARYGSTRFEGKPLADICGKSMIQRVYENCIKSRYLDKVIVATDDERILNHVKSFGGDAIMTSSEIKTGTDRCYEAIKDINSDFVVNIQGDEPLIEADIIDKTVEGLDKGFVCATPVSVLSDENKISDKNTVKAVFDKNGSALYFSRSAVPFLRNGEGVKTYRHIGLYVYDREFLSKFVNFTQTTLEKAESLEQLRILENGYKIKCVEVNYEPYGVDVVEDICVIEKLLKSK